MARTLTDVQTELDTVNAALQQVISGKRLVELRVGSGEFARLYRYAEINYDILKSEQQNLLMELRTLEATSSQSLSFRSNSYVPLSVNKVMR